MFNPTPEELDLVSDILLFADSKESRILSTENAIDVFERSALGREELREIWRLVDKDRNGMLTPKELAVALRLIGWVQAGEPLSGSLIELPGPLPTLEGISGVENKSRPTMSAPPQRPLSPRRKTRSMTMPGPSHPSLSVGNSHAPPPNFWLSSQEEKSVNRPKNASVQSPSDSMPRGEAVASRSGSQKPAQVNHRIAYFAATDAHEHLIMRQADIFKAMGSPEGFLVGLAGFNEGLMQSGNGVLLQEIHILNSEVVELQRSELDAIGKACSPFPSMIFMPSGETLRPPVFDPNGKLLEFEDVVKLFSFQPRFDVALRKGMALATHETTALEDQSTDHTEAGGHGDNQSSHATQSEPRGHPDPESQPTRRQPRDEPRSDRGESSDDGGVPVTRATASGQDETSPATRGHEHMQTPHGPPVPGKDPMTQEPHKIHFDIKASIHRPSPEFGLLQELKLIGDFNFQVTPGRTCIVEFTKMRCQAHNNAGTSYRYSQTCLKVLIDSYSPRWCLSKHKPKSTRASDGQVKRIEADKDSWQQSVKAGLSFIPFGGLKAEGSLAHTGERSTSTEAVRFNSRIIQQEDKGVFWWRFYVDDEHEKDIGIELTEDSLPFADMYVLPNNASPQTQPLNKLTVEMTSFWSLLGKQSGGWFSYTPGDTLPPGFSNICQVISIDLPPGDGSYVSEILVGAPGQPEQRKIVHSQSSITPTAAVLMFGGGARRSVEGLVDTSKRLLGV